MSNLPDHGDAFWDMFPKDTDGNTIIEEIDLDKYADLEPDPEIVAWLSSISNEGETGAR
ncbi:MAG: hypothetical protein RR213_07420 [Raoultibacter sp.]